MKKTVFFLLIIFSLNSFAENDILEIDYEFFKGRYFKQNQKEYRQTFFSFFSEESMKLFSEYEKAKESALKYNEYRTISLASFGLSYAINAYPFFYASYSKQADLNKLMPYFSGMSFLSILSSVYFNMLANSQYYNTINIYNNHKVNNLISKDNISLDINLEKPGFNVSYKF